MEFNIVSVINRIYNFKKFDGERLVYVNSKGKEVAIIENGKVSLSCADEFYMISALNNALKGSKKKYELCDRYHENGEIGLTKANGKWYTFEWNNADMINDSEFDSLDLACFDIIDKTTPYRNATSVKNKFKNNIKNFNKGINQIEIDSNNVKCLGIDQELFNLTLLEKSNLLLRKDINKEVWFIEDNGNIIECFDNLYDAVKYLQNILKKNEELKREKVR